MATPDLAEQVIKLTKENEILRAENKRFLWRIKQGEDAVLKIQAINSSLEAKNSSLEAKNSSLEALTNEMRLKNAKLFAINLANMVKIKALSSKDLKYVHTLDQIISLINAFKGRIIQILMANNYLRIQFNSLLREVIDKTIKLHERKFLPMLNEIPNMTSDLSKFGIAFNCEFIDDEFTLKYIINSGGAIDGINGISGSSGISGAGGAGGASGAGRSSSSASGASGSGGAGSFSSLDFDAGMVSVLPLAGVSSALDESIVFDKKVSPVDSKISKKDSEKESKKAIPSNVSKYKSINL